MLGIAVRLAQAIYLHLPYPPFEVRPFEHEMRKRLWHTIGALDTLLSLDHMSEPILHPDWLQSHPPSNINDSDISFDMESPVQEPEGYTDMTFPLITLNCICALRTLNFTDFSQPAIKSMNMRQQAAIAFQQTASRLLKGCQPDKVDFHWFTKQTAECMITTIQLVTVRPMQKCSGFVPPQVQGDGILEIVVQALRKLGDLHSDPRALPWRMSDGSFAIWHSIAVAVSEIRACGDPSLIETYWPFVEQAYESFSNVPDSQRGAVWKAVEKFMAQGRAHKNNLVGQGLSARKPVPQQPPPPPQQRQPNFPSTTPPAFSHPNIHPSAMAFAPIVTQQQQAMLQTQIMTMPEAQNMKASHIMGPWANVWDAVDYENRGLNGVGDASWLNYEGFIEDLYGNSGTA